MSLHKLHVFRTIIVARRFLVTLWVGVLTIFYTSPSYGGCCSEPPLVTVGELRSILADKRALFRVPCPQGVVDLRDAFIEKVHRWELEHHRCMYSKDLLQLQVEVDEYGNWRSASLATHDEPLPWRDLIMAAEGWHAVAKRFGWTLMYFRKHCRYEALFGLQVFFECARIGHPASQEYFVNRSLWGPFWELYPRDEYAFPPVAFPAGASEKWEQLKGVYLSEEDLGDLALVWKHRFAKALPLLGMPPDPPRESCCEWVSRLCGVPVRPLPSLPASPSDQSWQYIHEIDNEGFQVFMHIFHCLRDSP